MTNASAVARKVSSNRFVANPRRLSTAFLIAMAVAVATSPAAGETTGPAPICTVSEPTVAVFSGKFVNGVPVYRLPSISVSASRETELAKIGHEENLTRARQARVRPITRPPA